MLQKFSPQKAIQAAGVLLREHNGRMSRLRLLKMMYMGDRRSLQKIGRSITGDAVCALDHGPVLTQVYDLIKSENAHVAEWARFIRNEGPRDIILFEQTGVEKLSRFEVQTLQAIAAECENWDDWKVADHTHQFAEWIKNKPSEGSSKRISFDDVLEALHMSNMKEALVDAARVEAAEDKILSGPNE